MGWFNWLTQTEDEHRQVQCEAVKREEVVAVVKPEPKKDIGEPVLSLARSMIEEAEKWEESYSDTNLGCRSSYFSIAHEGGTLTIRFVDRYKPDMVTLRSSWKLECLMDWMTDDEKQLMVDVVLPGFRKAKAKLAEARRIERNKAEREKFMRELVPGHGQLALNLQGD